MLVPRGTVAPLTAIAIFIRPRLEDGEGDELKTDVASDWVEKHGGSSSEGFAPALAQPLTFSLPAVQQPGGSSRR
jgi:hypothetical protein